MQQDLTTKREKVRDSSRPKYQLVRDHVYGEISAGRFVPGHSLPTEAKLAEILGLSRQTVRQAFAELENDGIIIRIRGRGTFIATEQQRRARKQLNIFALIAPELRQGFYPSLVHGFEQASSAHQHQVLVSNSGNEIGRQGDLVLQMIDRSVGGVAMVPATTNPTPTYHVRQLQENHIPVVFCHRAVDGTSAPCVTWNGVEVGKKSGEALFAQGHRRVALLYTHYSSLAVEYETGLRSAMGDQNVVSIDYCAPITGDQLREPIRIALKKMLAESPRPTAVFCGNISHAEQIYLQAHELGLEIPRDLSLVAFGGTWRGHGLAERISCVAVDEHAVGAKAVELLHEMRSGKRALDDGERIVFPVSMLPGETIAPAAPI